MQKASQLLLGGGAKRPRTSSSSTALSSLRSAAAVAGAAAERSGPRTHLPFLLNVVRKAQGMTSTAGTSAPCRVYPKLPAGATKQPDGSTILFKDNACITVNDAFPKSSVHCLVMPLDLSLRSLNDLRYNPAPSRPGKRASSAISTSSSTVSRCATTSPPSVTAPLSNGLDHLQLLRHMDTTAQSYVTFLKKADPATYGARRFITGFHSLPSLPMLHMHLLSMDLDSPCLKTKKHYNSFASFFFLTADRVIEDLERNGRVTINQNAEELEKMENQPMTCLWCGTPLSTIPAMKRHVSSCSKNKAAAR